MFGDDLEFVVLRHIDNIDHRLIDNFAQRLAIFRRFAPHKIDTNKRHGATLPQQFPSVQVWYVTSPRKVCNGSFASMVSSCPLPVYRQHVSNGRFSSICAQLPATRSAK